MALILSLLILPNSSFAYNQISSLASTAMEVGSVPIHYLPTIFKWLFKAKPVQPRKESLAERAAAVSRLQISPARFVGYLGQSMKFNALPMNSFDQVIQGVKLSWESSDTDKVQIDDAGKATFLQPGRVTITCRAGTAAASVTVQVRPGNRPAQSDEEWKNDQRAVAADGSTTTGSLLPKLFDKLMPTVEAQGNGSGDLGYDELYSDAKNLTGSPLNRVAEGTRIGAVLPEGSNFEFAVPLVSLGGRGIGTSIALFYNSRVWSRRNNAMAFDAINGEPSPGFALGFGRVVAYQSGANYRLIWVEADGTRHYLGQGSYFTTQTYTTTDGSDISYTGNVAYGGTISYPNGTYLSIQVVNNRLLPTQITDRNNNYISITYKDSLNGFSPNAIDFVTDTLGRVVQFNYDSNYRLVSIVAPGFGGTSQNPVSQTIAQFDYQTVNVTTNFSGLTIEKYPSGSSSYLKHVYFPATNYGYLFTYSGYGMIYNVSMRRGMSINFQGVIADGTENAAVAFNYPTSGATQLTDAPAFTQRIETAVNVPSATFSYSSTTDTTAQTKTFTITRPDATTVNLTRSTNGSSIANGLLTQTEIKSGATTLAKSVLSYVTAVSAARVQSVIGYDETNTPTKVDFDYDSYGNITNKREYGFQINGNWQVRRRTHFTYNTSLGIQGLVTLTEVFDAQQTPEALIAKSSVTYDDYQAMGGLENYGGTANPPGHLSGNPRGNVTGTTAWYDLANNLSITHLMKYDIFGNVLKEQVSCCNLKTFVIPESNGYAMPEEVVSGDESGVHLTESVDTDFNTGVIWRQTDERGKQITKEYDAALRLRQVNLFTGAVGSAAFNDSSLSVSSTVTYTEDGITKNLTTTKNFDGWHRVISEVNAYGAQINTTYNAMGQVTSVTNPFTAGGTPSYATSYQYDALGRQTLVTLPDNNTVQTAYNGATVTVTDQVNRKIKRESDGLGRLVKVTEQDVASGTLTQETSYTYNLLDKLTGVNQGNQMRAWKYDNAGRLLYERIPEQTPTINDGTGTLWTTQYTYTSFNAVATRKDARGVVTSYSYDGLNRLTGVSYNTSGASNVASTGGVTMSYDTNQQSATNGLLLSVSVANSNGVGTFYAESYSYDANNRVASLTRTLEGKSYTTSYEYNQASQLTKLTYPSSYYYYLNHDNLGRLQALSPLAPGGNGNTYYLSNVNYNTAGQVTGLTLGNGVVESYGYSADRMHLTSQTATKNSTTLLSLSYSYAASAGQSGAGSTAGNSGQLMSLTGSLGGMTESAAYTYDNLGRLVTSNQTTNGVSAQRRFAYDRWGNRTGMWDATSGGNQLQSVSLQQSGGAPTNRLTSVTNGSTTVNYLYDANGNVTNDGVRTYTYDTENRVVSVDGGTTAQYAYDQQNRRVKKVVSGTTTHYVWIGNKVLAEHNGATGAVITNYTFAGGVKIGQGTGGVTQYYLSDKLSERALLDSSGNVVGRQAHLPFGEELGSSGTPEKHHFTSYERDAENGMDYAVNRFHSYKIGRFNAVDPLAKSANPSAPQSWNRYSYTKNDPINMIDPWGLFGCPGCSATDDPCNIFGPIVIWNGIPIDRELLCPVGPFGEFEPIPTAPQPELDLPKHIVKHPAWEMNCTKNAEEAMSELKSRFTDLASWSNIFGSFINFERVPIREGARILIATGLWVPGVDSVVIPKSFHVRVTSESPTSWIFTTENDHVFFPGTISFSMTSQLPGVLLFQIDLDGYTNGISGYLGYILGGGAFEDDTWDNLAKGISKEICGNPDGEVRKVSE